MKSYPWKLALVTGAASGIGRQFCIALARQGCALVLVDRAPVDDTLAELPEGTPTTVITADLTDSDAVDGIFRRLRRDGLKPGLLVNNAGIFDFSQVVDLSPRRIDLYIDLHIRAVTRLSRQMAIMMAENGGGNILNMSSMSCWMPMPGIAMYSATKAYIRVFSRALGVETRDNGVKVTVACPGGIATDLFGLPQSLQRLGVRLGVLYTPQRFVRNVLVRTARGRKQYINGPVNRLAIVFMACLPEGCRRLIKTKILSRYGSKPNNG